MKLTCQQQDLSKALNTVQKAVTNRTTIPILKGILLEVNETDILTISASDLDLSIQTKISVENTQEGSIVVSAKLFTEIIRKLPSGEIQISLSDNHVIINSYNSEFSIIGQPSDDFPKIDVLSNSKSIKIHKEIFKNMIKQTSFSASIDESRGIITGVLIEIEKEKINMVALDGFRMGIRKENMLTNKNEDIIIPARILNEVYKILADEEGDSIDLLINNKNIIIRMDHTIILSRLLEGDFINYKEIVPKSFNCKVKVNKEDLLDSIERASLLAREGKNNLIKINIEEQKMIISSRSEEGKVHEEVFIEKEGEGLEIGFNSKYILDILRNIDDDEVFFEFISNVSPCLVKPLEGDNFEYLILPVRISVN